MKYSVSYNYNAPNVNKTTLPFNQRWTTQKFAYSVTLVWRFCSCDLDLDLMTLIYEYDLGILKKYPDTKNLISRSRLSKVRAWKRQTHRLMNRCNQKHYYYAAFVGGNNTNFTVKCLSTAHDACISANVTLPENKVGRFAVCCTDWRMMTHLGNTNMINWAFYPFIAKGNNK